MRIERLTLGELGTNCVLVAGETPLCVDPAADAPALLAAFARLGFSAPRIVLTHAHFDHMLALNALGAQEVWAHPLEEAALRDPAVNASVDFGAPFSSALPLRPLCEGDTIGGFQVLHTPGHRPGCICLYSEVEALLLSGDTLFCAGYGRTDLPGGSMAQLLHSLRRLLALPGYTRVVPGHGGETTIAAEKARYGL